MYLKMHLKISKRQRFIAVALVLGLVFFLFQAINPVSDYLTIVILVVLTGLFSGWSLRDGLSGLEWLTVLLPSLLFSAAFCFLSFFVTDQFWIRVVVVFIYTLGVYVNLLIGNIFSVAAIRTIQLLRSAHAVSFLMTLICGFFLYNAVFSYRLPFWANVPLIALVAFLLALPSLWSVQLATELTRPLLSLVGVLTLVLAETALVFSFWPVSVTVRSLVLTIATYVGFGLSQHFLSGRLFSQTVKEYLIVGLISLVAIFLTTSWQG